MIWDPETSDVGDLTGGPIFCALRDELKALRKNKKKNPPRASADRLEKMMRKTQKKRSNRFNWRRLRWSMRQLRNWYRSQQ